MSRDCKHGQLARSCELCELQETIEHQRAQIEIWKAIAAERADRIKDRNAMLIRIRAFAARAMHGGEDPEYPMTKGDLRAALRSACGALEAIATNRVPETPGSPSPSI